MKILTKMFIVGISAFMLLGFAPGALATAPSAITSDAVSITSSSATFRGSVDPNGLTTVFWFEYGIGSFTHQTSSSSAGAGSDFSSFSSPVSGLSPSTTYIFRIVASNSAGINRGNTQTFTTLSVVAQQPATTFRVQLSASPRDINQGESATLSWESSMATGCTIATSVGTGLGAVEPNGARIVRPATTTRYTLSCRHIDGSANIINSEAIVTVASQPTTIASALVLPSSITNSPTHISASSASFHGSVNPNGLFTTYWFEYGIGNFVNQTSSFSAGSGASFISGTYIASGLSSNTTYSFRIVASNSAGIQRGNTQTFTTLSVAAVTPPPPSAPTPVLPSAVTSDAINITSSSVTFRGSVDPNSFTTTYWFEYGIGNFTHQTSSSSAGSGTHFVSVVDSVSGLSPNTTYSFRIVASNSAGIQRGNTQTFTTLSVAAVTPPPPPPPSAPTPVRRAPDVTISHVDHITEDSVVFRGHVNPNNDRTTYWFEYGTWSGNLHLQSPRWTINAFVGNTAVSAFQHNLSPNTTYYYRLVAHNSHGIARSSILSFTTHSNFRREHRNPPFIRTISATGISSNSAILNAEVTTNNADTDVWFEYGYTGQALNYSSIVSTIRASDFSRAIAIDVRGLRANTRYTFRAFARNTHGTVRGETISFATHGAIIIAHRDAPQVTTVGASNIGPNAVILQSRIDPGTRSATMWFEYGTSAFDLRWRSTSVTVPAHIGLRDYSITLSGLSANTLYFYRAVAQNIHGTDVGEVKFFTTTGARRAPVARDPAPKPRVEICPVAINNETNVFLDSSVSALEARAGETIYYVLTYRNASRDRITNASIRVFLPFESEYIDSSIRPSARTGNNLIFDIGDIENGHQGAITIKVRLREDALVGGSLMFNSTLEFTDARNQFQTVNSHITVTVTEPHAGFLASLNALARSISGSWLFLLLFIIMLISLIYLLVTRRRDSSVVVQG